MDDAPERVAPAVLLPQSANTGLWQRRERSEIASHPLPKPDIRQGVRLLIAQSSRRSVMGT